MTSLTATTLKTAPWWWERWGHQPLPITSHDLLSSSSSEICINSRQFLLHSLVSCVTVSFVRFFFILAYLVFHSAFFQHHSFLVISVLIGYSGCCITQTLTAGGAVAVTWQVSGAAVAPLSLFLSCRCLGKENIRVMPRATVSLVTPIFLI